MGQRVVMLKSLKLVFKLQHLHTLAKTRSSTISDLPTENVSTGDQEEAKAAPSWSRIIRKCRWVTFWGSSRQFLSFRFCFKTHIQTHRWGGKAIGFWKRYIRSNGILEFTSLHNPTGFTAAMKPVSLIITIRVTHPSASHQPRDVSYFVGCTWRRVKSLQKAFHSVSYDSRTVLRQPNPVILLRPPSEELCSVSLLCTEILDGFDSFFAITVIMVYHPAWKVPSNVRGGEKPLVACPQCRRSPNRSPQQRVTLAGGPAWLFHTIITRLRLGFFFLLRYKRGTWHDTFTPASTNWSKPQHAATPTPKFTECLNSVQ